LSKEAQGSSEGGKSFPDESFLQRRKYSKGRTVQRGNCWGEQGIAYSKVFHAAPDNGREKKNRVTTRKGRGITGKKKKKAVGSASLKDKMRGLSKETAPTIAENIFISKESIKGALGRGDNRHERGGGSGP